MNNPTDKNGNVINTGDRVVYMKGTPDEDHGVVTHFDECFGEIRPYAKWGDGRVLHCNPKDIEVEVSVITTDTFTKEDQAMLQMLIAKKEKAAKLRDAAEESLANLVENFYDAASDCKVRTFMVKNIDKICDTLQTYKKHFTNN